MNSCFLFFHIDKKTQLVYLRKKVGPEISLQESKSSYKGKKEWLHSASASVPL